MTDSLGRTIEIHPGYDRRPSPEGMHGAEMVFILRGPKGVVTFACFTDWLPKATQQGLMHGVERSGVIGIQPKPLEYAFHAPEPSETVRRVMHTDCPYMDGGVCWTELNTNTAEYIRDLLLQGGSDAVWLELETRYRASARIIANAKPRKVQL